MLALKEMKMTLISILMILFVLPIVLSNLNFESRENDSRLYVKFVEQLTERPLSEILALEWRNTSAYVDPESPYVRDHLIGQFIPSVLLSKLGWNPKYAHYIINQLYRFIIPLLFFYLISILFSREAATLNLIAIQLNIIGLNYVFRANQELPLLFCLTLAIMAESINKESKTSKFLFYLSNVGTFLIKGFAGLIYLPFWSIQSILLAERRKKIFLKFSLLLLILMMTALIYELWFKNITQSSFWEAYVRIQLLGRNPEDGKLFSSFFYYLSRLLANSLPWSLGLIPLYQLFKKHHFSKEQKKFMALLGAITLAYLLIFGLFPRKASRYIFPAYFYLTSLGAIGFFEKFKHKMNLSRLNPYFINASLFWAILIINLVIFVFGGKKYT